MGWRRQKQQLAASSTFVPCAAAAGKKVEDAAGAFGLQLLPTPKEASAFAHSGALLTRDHGGSSSPLLL